MTKRLLKFVKLPYNDKHGNVYQYCFCNMYRELCKKNDLENQTNSLEYDYKIKKYHINTKILEKLFLMEKVIEIREFINLDALHLTTEQISDLLIFHSNEDEYLERINFLLGKTYFKENITEELIKTVMHPKNFGRLWHFDE